MPQIYYKDKNIFLDRTNIVMFTLKWKALKRIKTAKATVLFSFDAHIPKLKIHVWNKQAVVKR